MSTTIFERLEQLRREQGHAEESVDKRPVLHMPAPEPMDLISGSVEPDQSERGVYIVDFTI